MFFSTPNAHISVDVSQLQLKNVIYGFKEKLSLHWFKTMGCLSVWWNKRNNHLPALMVHYILTGWRKRSRYFEKCQMTIIHDCTILETFTFNVYSKFVPAYFRSIPVETFMVICLPNQFKSLYVLFSCIEMKL